MTLRSFQSGTGGDEELLEPLIDIRIQASDIGEAKVKRSSSN